jgi:hypothetical protein
MKDPKLNLGAVLYLAEMVQGLDGQDVLVVRRFTVKRVGPKKVALQGRRSSREITRNGETFHMLALDSSEAMHNLRAQLTDSIASAGRRLDDATILRTNFDVQRSIWCTEDIK